MIRKPPRGRVGHGLDGQDGSSPVTAIGGLAIFLGFLFLVVQVTVHLYASSTAATVAIEAATRAAQQGGSCDRATSWAANQVGAWADPPGCLVDGDEVQVTVRGDSPAVTMRLFSTATGLDSITRKARVRVEVGIDG